ncbi:MAG: ABC transporter ATP-binding protein [Candidatus Thermoplasmatota archaeon]|nr:ABC transporter ATP-binding protein [Candidatus Thermoplasmatota archaeon]
MSEVIIQVENLSKHYPPDVKAVDDISFMIKPKQIFSMLGPNGAGKTTTVEILEGLRSPTSGTASIFGVDVTRDYTKIRSRVGVLPQNFEPFDELKPPEAVRYWAGLFDIRMSKKEVNDLLESVSLADRKNLISKKLSGGEKRKLGIALSLINNPELLFLDEPTTGLDPKARRDLWRLVEDIRKKGTTVFLTTHYLDEAEKLSDDVAIMHKGKIIARGSPEELIAKYSKVTVVVLVGVGKDGLREISRRGITATEEEGDVMVPVRDPSEMRTVFAKLSALQLNVKDMYTRRQTLEDVFLGLVGAKMEEGVLKE